MSQHTQIPTSSRPSSWRFNVRLLAFLLASGMVVFWGLKGANRGWTQNQVPVRELDEVTGLEKVTYEKRFVPGLEVLGAGLLTSSLLIAVSFWPKRKAAVAKSL